MQGYAAQFARIEQDYFRERMTDIRDVISADRLAPDAQARCGHADRRRRVAQRRRAGHPGRARDPAQPGDEPGRPADRRDRHRDRRRRPATPRSWRGAAASRPSRASTGSRATSARGDLMIVDGRDGMVLVRPDREATSAYRKMQREFFNLKDRLVPTATSPPAAPTARRSSCWPTSTTSPTPRPPRRSAPPGVGLFRTEYLFLTHHDVPDEEEQYEYYRQIIEDSPNQTVTIRTLDLGGDKTVPYLGRRSEANPFMGWRSIRIFFEHPKLFEHADPRHPPRRPARQGLDALPDDHHAGRAAARQQAGQGDPATTCAARACRSARTSRRA